MAKKAKEISIEDFLRDNLQSTLQKELGKKNIESTEMPEYFGTSLNPYMKLRPYQREAFQYFINYCENDWDGKAYKPQLLFHMATGSGKTLIMAGVILYLYEKGYRNFLFFVNSGNVIEKTKDNFFNTASSKYLFASQINIGNKVVEVRQVDNFQSADENCINLCLTTIQGLHIDLNTPKENAVTIDDFKDKRVVLIADEAHHINTATKKGDQPEQPMLPGLDSIEDWGGSDDWETTVMAIFNSNDANVLLEFTATEDFANAAIADKYKDKVLFDYPLKKFREDGYSKDIRTLQSDLQPIDRAVQAVILSQFRRKLASSIRQDIKPVVMFKSKTISANKLFHDEFVQTIKHLNVDTLQRIKDNAREDMLDAFTYFEQQGILLENLLLELQEDFKEENLLLVDGNTITPQKQQQLNSLEAKDNEFRAVFAVDMLNEGWDVLNLYDIVRMYDTRDAKNGVVGKTTNQEAQLIGRGARLMPFTDKPEEQLIANDSAVEYKSKRKFDGDLGNNLRYLETLHYHSAANSRYIQELNTALVQTGIISEKSKEITERMKESFKKTRLYTDGYVFANNQESRLQNKEVTDIGTNILNKTFTVRISTGEMQSSEIFSKPSTSETVTLKQHTYELGEFGENVLRCALNRFECFKYNVLSEVYPNLKSIKEFIESASYLAKIKVTVYGREEIVNNLTQKQKLFTVVEVLRQIEPMLSTGGIITVGSKRFNGKQFRDVFRTEHRYKVTPGGADKEEGVSMKETTNIYLRLDLSTADWYIYDDNFGTSEEKYLIKYIDEIMPKLQQKYSDVYLVRNYKELKVYAFDDGRATEPDFILFMRRKGEEEQYDNLQIFIEPKGEHLRAADKWKEAFELSIHDNAEIHFETPNDKFIIWGMPFFTNNRRQEFEKAMKESFGIK